MRSLLALSATFSFAQATAALASDERIELQHGGLARSAIVHVPPKPLTPAPLVLNFHGGGGNAASHQKYTRMDALADREGFVVAYPDGSGRLKDKLLTWNAGACCGSAARDRVDDVGFAIALIDELSKRMAIDAKRVYATGFSNGAMMTHRLAAERPDRIAAIATIAGAMVFTGAPKAPVPVLHIHSVDDPRALYAGGLGPPFPMTTSQVLHPPVEESLARWAKANGCTGTPLVAETRTGSGDNAGISAAFLLWPGCSAPLAHWKLTGSGHTWPGGTPKYLPRLLGRGTDLVDANVEMWKFFSKRAR
jgi:polyhydroxybutyrate depolymerase